MKFLRYRRPSLNTLPVARISKLDGLRGLALLLVVGYHAAPSVVRGGFIGVEVFFVLSGYLLAGHLLDEMSRTGRVDVLSFYERRIRRIGPALMVLIFALLIIAPIVLLADYRLRGDILSSLAGVTNWRLIAGRSSYFQQFAGPSPVRHLWSISVELQFYLLCPFLVLWLGKRSRGTAVAILAAAMAASAGLMALLYLRWDPVRAYYGTDARVGALLAGVLLAFLVVGQKPSHSPRSGSSVWAAYFGWAGLVCLLAITFLADERSGWLYPLGFMATQAAFAPLIAGRFEGRLARLFESRFLVWFGKRSYGIYLWHWPLIVLIQAAQRTWPALIVGAFSLVIAVIVGALSYRFIEMPFMKIPRSKRTNRRTTNRLVLVAVSIFTLVPAVALAMRLPTSDPLKATLRQGERALANQVLPEPSPLPLVLTAVVPPAPPVVAPPPAPAPPPPPPAAPIPERSGPPPGSVRVTAVGDSVMITAAVALQARLGPSAYIDADKGRQFQGQLQAIRTLRDGGRLADVVVLHFGNNGPVSDAQVDGLLAKLGSVPHIVLVTNRVNKPWQDPVNRVFRSAADRNPKVKIADWFGLSAGHSEWFQADGTHFKTTSGPGARAYAELIGGSIPEPTPTPPIPEPNPTPQIPEPTPTPPVNGGTNLLAPLVP
ncbi:MAG: acyltransferase family protein [Actinomycetota bacterium]